MNRILLELETSHVGIYLDSVRHRNYYQFVSGILESEIGELHLA